MVKLTKSPLPSGVSIRSENDYRSDPVFALLSKDCNEKCYICENGEATSYNVEHLIPHRGDSALKFDWNNLFLSCAHCNGLKRDTYEHILDCTKVDPEQYIALRLGTELKEKIQIEKLGDCENPAYSVDETITLLSRVYNAEHEPPMKRLEATKLRNRVSREVSDFRNALDLFYQEAEGEIRERYRDEIRGMLHRSSNFAAFKRQIVRASEKYRADFEMCLE